MIYIPYMVYDIIYILICTIQYGIYRYTNTVCTSYSSRRVEASLKKSTSGHIENPKLEMLLCCLSILCRYVYHIWYIYIPYHIYCVYTVYTYIFICIPYMVYHRAHRCSYEFWLAKISFSLHKSVASEIITRSTVVNGRQFSGPLASNSFPDPADSHLEMNG